MHQPIPRRAVELVPLTLQMGPDFRIHKAFSGKKKGHVLTFVPKDLISSHGSFVRDPARVDTKIREGTRVRNVEGLVPHAFHHRRDLPIRSVRSQTPVYNSNNPRHDTSIPSPSWHTTDYASV